MRVSPENRRMVLETIIAEGLKEGGMGPEKALPLSRHVRESVERAEAHKLILLNVATYAHERVRRLRSWRSTALQVLQRWVDEELEAA